MFLIYCLFQDQKKAQAEEEDEDDHKPKKKNLDSKRDKKRKEKEATEIMEKHEGEPKFAEFLRVHQERTIMTEFEGKKSFRGRLHVLKLTLALQKL
jgi:hypothetical protein